MLVFTDTGTEATGGPGFLGGQLWRPSLDKNPGLQDDSFRPEQEGNTGSSCRVVSRVGKTPLIGQCVVLGLIVTDQKQMKNHFRAHV